LLQCSGPVDTWQLESVCCVGWQVIQPAIYAIKPFDNGCIIRPLPLALKVDAANEVKFRQSTTEDIMDLISLATGGLGCLIGGNVLGKIAGGRAAGVGPNSIVGIIGGIIGSYLLGPQLGPMVGPMIGTGLESVIGNLLGGGAGGAGLGLLWGLIRRFI
jgi:hypothetical protein